MSACVSVPLVTSVAGVPGVVICLFIPLAILGIPGTG
jgi:hypothetical protein